MAKQPVWSNTTAAGSVNNFLSISVSVEKYLFELARKLSEIMIVKRIA